MDNQRDELEPPSEQDPKPAKSQRVAMLIAVLALGMVLSPFVYLMMNVMTPAEQGAYRGSLINRTLSYWYDLAAREPQSGDVMQEADYYYMDEEALYQAGLRALYGRGEKQDDAKALRLYRICAQRRYAECEYSLAYMYGEGRGVKQSQSEAFYWMERAARRGHAVAQDNLGVAYGDGRGVKQDWVQSYIWIARSAAQGNAQAKDDLVYARAHMTKEQVKEAQRRLAEEERDEP